MGQLGKTTLLEPDMGAAPAQRTAGAKVDRRKLGVILLATASVATLVFVGFRTFSNFQSSPGMQSRYRTVVDAQSGEVFIDFKVPRNSTFPLKNPKTGSLSLYMGEPCYWTKDGKAKLTPTWVLVRETIGEPGPTKCPDCGRRVVPHNPTPPDQLMIEAARAASK